MLSDTLEDEDLKRYAIEAENALEELWANLAVANQHDAANAVNRALHQLEVEPKVERDRDGVDL